MITRKSLFVLITLAFFIISGCLDRTEQPKGRGGPPNATITIAGKDVSLTRGAYRWEEKGPFSANVTTVDAASPYQIAKQLEAAIV